MRYVERRGYLTLCLEGQGLSRTYLRRTEGIREWGKLIMDCVKRKKDEFERDMSPCDLLRYPRYFLEKQTSMKFPHLFTQTEILRVMFKETSMINRAVILKAAKRCSANKIKLFLEFIHKKDYIKYKQEHFKYSTVFALNV